MKAAVLALILGLAAAPRAEAATPLSVKDNFLVRAEAGLRLQRDGDWAGAAKQLESALVWAEAMEPMSVSRGLVSMTEDDRRLAYKPSPVETQLLHAFALIGYARMGQTEALEVESRRIDQWASECLQRSDGAWALRLVFPRLLSAWAHEQAGRLSDALIELRGARHAAFLNGSPTAQVDADLLRLALPHDGELRPDERDAPQRAAGLSTAKPRAEGEGDLLILFFRGQLPTKQPERKGPTLVGLYHQEEPLDVWRGDLLVDGQVGGRLELVDDLAALLDAELRDHQTAEYARSAVRETAKAAAAVTVKMAAAVAGIQISGNMEQSEADLRSWTALPAQVYVGRVRASAGVHDVTVQLLEADGSQGPARVLAGQRFEDRRTGLYTRWFK